jgi:hypothetical protein
MSEEKDQAQETPFQADTKRKYTKKAARECKTPNEELRLALWFIDKISDPLRAKQIVDAACKAMCLVRVDKQATDKVQ